MIHLKRSNRILLNSQDVDLQARSPSGSNLELLLCYPGPDVYVSHEESSFSGYQACFPCLVRQFPLSIMQKRLECQNVAVPG